MDLNALGLTAPVLLALAGWLWRERTRLIKALAAAQAAHQADARTWQAQQQETNAVLSRVIERLSNRH